MTSATILPPAVSINEEPSAFGPLLRMRRYRTGLSLEGLAAIVDVDHAHLSRLEGGSRRPSLALAIRLADALCLDPTAWLAFVQAAEPLLSRVVNEVGRQVRR